MTVEELIEELKKMPSGALVVMSKDAEGNDYSPLTEVDGEGTYTADTTWSGEFEHYGQGKPAVCLWPVN